MKSALLIVAALGCGALTLPHSPTNESTPDPANELFQPLGVSAVMAISVGLTPEVLAAAGLSVEQVRELLASADSTESRAALVSLGSALELQDSALAQDAIIAARSAARDAMLEHVPQNTRPLLRRLMLGLQSGLPLDLAAVVDPDRFPTDAKRVQQLLVAEARAARLSRTPEPAAANELRRLRALPASVEVRDRLATSLGAISAVFAEN